MLQELIALEEKFQPFLLKKDYTFIGPVDQNLFKPFFSNANNFAPVVSFSRSIHHVLSHKESVRKAIALLPTGTPMRIFVVTPARGDILLHSDIEGYCKRNNINFPPDINES